MIYGLNDGDTMKKIDNFNDFKNSLLYIFEELNYIDKLYLLYVAFDQQPELFPADLLDTNRQCCVNSYILSVYKLFDCNSSLNIFSIIEYMNNDLTISDCDFLSISDWYNKEKKYFDKQHSEYYNSLEKIKTFRNKVIAHSDIELIKSQKFEKIPFIDYWKLINLAKDIIAITIKKYDIELDINSLRNHKTYIKELNI